MHGQYLEFPPTDRAEILNLDCHEVNRSESKSWQMAFSEALTSVSGEEWVRKEKEGGHPEIPHILNRQKGEGVNAEIFG